MKTNPLTSATGALILMASALAGAGISYHFTLEARFAAIEQKLDQNSFALEHYQASVEETSSAKAAILDGLDKKVEALQLSLEPLGTANHVQSESLTAIRQQIQALQQEQKDEKNAQEQLTDYGRQLDLIRTEIQRARSAPHLVSLRAIPLHPAEQESAPTTSSIPASRPALAEDGFTFNPPAVSQTPTLPAPHAAPSGKESAELRPVDLLRDGPGSMEYAAESLPNR